MTSLADFVTQKTQSVYDYEFVKALAKVPMDDWMEQSPPFDCRKEYLETIHKLILSSKLNSVSGLERFPIKHLINGTTQSFDEFYHRYHNRRLRIFRGEYAYHKRVNPNFVFIEDEPLKTGDTIIISNPFCSLGDTHPQYNWVLDKALELSLPVEIDCAYFGTCHSLNLDLTHQAISAVSFSLTKGFGLGDIRSGIRFSFYDDDMPIAQQNNYDHSVLLAAKIGLYMMEQFDFDHIPSKFREAQESACAELQISPTKCMHLALGDERWDDYKVDNAYNRLGIRELVKKRFQGKI